MKIEKVKINSIKENPNNPRIIKGDKFNKLVKSIQDFPEMLKIRPIVVNSDNIILGGNMRHKASINAGLKDVYIIRAENLTEKQQREFIVKDNVGFGEWDWDVLANDWGVKELEDWGLDGFPFEEEEKELKDISDSNESSFRVEIELENEEEQEKLYNDLIEKGYKCKILTL